MFNPAILQEKALYTSLLLGFAVSIAVALIALRDRRRIATATVVVFMIAAFLLFLDTFSSMRLLIEIQRLGEPLPAEAVVRLTRAAATVRDCDTLGLFALVGGIGLSGWIHSRLVGALTTLGALATFALILRFSLILGAG